MIMVVIATVIPAVFIAEVKSPPTPNQQTNVSNINSENGGLNSSIANVTQKAGFALINITPNLVKEESVNPISQDIVTWPRFNDTFVIDNKLDSQITFSASANSSSEKFLYNIPAGQMQVTNLTSLIVRNNGILHYQVDEFPQIHGNLIVKKLPTLVDKEYAKLLYHQFGFDVKFPSYMPEGVVPLFNLVTGFPWQLTEYFGDETFLGENPSTIYDKITSCHKACHVITVGANKETGQNSTQSLYLMYLLLKQNATLHISPAFSITNGTVIMQPSGSNLSPILIAKGDEQYVIDGSFPIDELIKMAKSLS